jgi:hypothetical protein
MLARPRYRDCPRILRVTIHTVAPDGKKELTSQLVARLPLGVQLFF